jgi:cobalt-zinc-cadmium efflux system membrane fusion protein
MTRRNPAASTVLVLAAVLAPATLHAQSVGTAGHRGPGPHGRGRGALHRVTIPAGSPQLKQIRTQSVATAPVTADEVVAPGRITLDPRRAHRVVLPVAGRVVQVLARVGDAVRAGQPLLVIDSAEAEAALAECRQGQAV